MNTTSGATEANVSVNADGQIVWRAGRVETPVCQHIFDPVVLPRAMSLAIAKAVIAAEVEDAEVERPAGIHELWSASRGVRVFAPVDAKPLEVLAVVAELLGLRPVPTVPGEPTAEERAQVEAGKRGPFVPHAEVERTLAQRAHAAGIVEGLRRAERIAGEVRDADYIRRRIDDEIHDATANVAPADREPAPFTGGGAG
jgi:hypothetical protein